MFRLKVTIIRQTFQYMDMTYTMHWTCYVITTQLMLSLLGLRVAVAKYINKNISSLEKTSVFQSQEE
jgi:hypothetical protein